MLVVQTSKAMFAERNSLTYEIRCHDGASFFAKTVTPASSRKHCNAARQHGIAVTLCSILTRTVSNA